MTGTRGGLRSRFASATPARACSSVSAISWVYNDPGLHYALVVDRGWTQQRYRSWLTDTLRHQLLG